MLTAFLACLLFVREIRKKKPITPEKSGKRPPILQNPAFIKVSLMFVYSVVYILAVDWVGFFATTVVSIPIMIWLLGVRKPSTIITATGVVVLFIFVVFSIFLKVPFPEGLLF